MLYGKTRQHQHFFFKQKSHRCSWKATDWTMLQNAVSILQYCNSYLKHWGSYWSWFCLYLLHQHLFSLQRNITIITAPYSLLSYTLRQSRHLKLVLKAAACLVSSALQRMHITPAHFYLSPKTTYFWDLWFSKHLIFIHFCNLNLKDSFVLTFGSKQYMQLPVFKRSTPLKYHIKPVCCEIPNWSAYF